MFCGHSPLGDGLNDVHGDYAIKPFIQEFYRESILIYIYIYILTLGYKMDSCMFTKLYNLM